MKKYLLIIGCLFLIVGCSLIASSPTKATEEFLQRYKNLNEGVISDLELSSERTGLTSTNHKAKYVDVMKRQYQDMSYEIIEEEIDGDEATVEVKVTVYDLYKARFDAEEYINIYQPEFYVDNVKDVNKSNDYILESLYKSNERIDYTLDIDLKKVDGKWEVQELNSITKEKLHGTYNYTNN